jgi:hypothetical protein
LQAEVHPPIRDSSDLGDSVIVNVALKNLVSGANSLFHKPLIFQIALKTRPPDEAAEVFVEMNIRCFILFSSPDNDERLIYCETRRSLVGVKIPTSGEMSTVIEVAIRCQSPAFGKRNGKTRYDVQVISRVGCQCPEKQQTQPQMSANADS